MTLRYASVCDGIGAAHVAWAPLGMACAWTSEIDPFPAAVVETRWGFPNLGDMTAITKERAAQHGPIDILVGGTPCQSFSVAGLRQGLADPRGNLALEFLRLADALKARWVVWENVPGVLSSAGGRDFGAFLGALDELGYGWAYRTLDAQYVRVESHPRAVPQRRRRVFVVGHLGDQRRACQVLLEREGVLGHPPPRREAGQGAAADAARGAGSGGSGVARVGDTRGQDPVVAVRGDVSHTLRGEGCDASEDGTGRGTPIVAQPYEIGNCLTRRMHKGINTTLDEGQTPVVVDARQDPVVASNVSIPIGSRDTGHAITIEIRGRADGRRLEHRQDGTANALRTASGGRDGIGIGAVAHGMAVRRLTPRECERLQGFPDDYTLIGFRGKPASDTARYKALGNSMAANCMSWIGRRILLAEGGA